EDGLGRMSVCRDARRHPPVPAPLVERAHLVELDVDRRRQLAGRPELVISLLVEALEDDLDGLEVERHQAATPQARARIRSTTICMSALVPLVAKARTRWLFSSRNAWTTVLLTAIEWVMRGQSDAHVPATAVPRES